MAGTWCADADVRAQLRAQPVTLARLPPQQAAALAPQQCQAQRPVAAARCCEGARPHPSAVVLLPVPRAIQSNPRQGGARGARRVPVATMTAALGVRPL